MLTLRRAVVLGLFVACLVVSSHTPTHAQVAGKERHPVIHKAIRDMRDAHKKMKALKPIFGGHREKALKHMDEAMGELHKAIKFVDGEAKK